MESCQLVLASNGIEDGLGDQGLRVPVSQSIHYSAGFLVRVHRAVVGIILILKRCICIQCGFCNTSARLVSARSLARFIVEERHTLLLSLILLLVGGQKHIIRQGSTCDGTLCSHGVAFASQRTGTRLAVG